MRVEPGVSAQPAPHGLVVTASTTEPTDRAWRLICRSRPFGRVAWRGAEAAMSAWLAAVRTMTATTMVSIGRR